MMQKMQKKLKIETAALLAPFILAFLPFVAIPVIITASINNEPDLADRISASAEFQAPEETSEKKLPVRKKTTSSIRPIGLASYDPLVMGNLKKMDLPFNAVDGWLLEHPDSSLRYLPYMSAVNQRNVAKLAEYIRDHNSRIDAKTAWREAAALVHYSNKYGVPTALVAAVAHTESTFDPSAVSSRGARGVMQVMWNVHYGLLSSNGIDNIEAMADPEKGIAAGCLLLSRYIRAYGSAQGALNRYYGAISSSYQRKINTKMLRLLSHAQIQEPTYKAN